MKRKIVRLVLLVASTSSKTSSRVKQTRIIVDSTTPTLVVVDSDFLE